MLVSDTWFSDWIVKLDYQLLGVVIDTDRLKKKKIDRKNGRVPCYALCEIFFESKWKGASLTWKVYDERFMAPRQKMRGGLWQ